MNPLSINASTLDIIREKLGQYRTVRRVSWKTGSLLHHTLPQVAARWSGRTQFTDPDVADGALSSTSRSASSTNPSSPSDPLSLRSMTGVHNPVLTASDVTDFGDADGVADPFMFVDGDEWHMFMEVYNRDRDPRAAIGHATSSNDGRSWEYDAIVLRGDHHLSFPYVFQWDGTHYLVPDRWNRQTDSDSVTLYEARRFPDEWTEVATIRETDHPLHDVVLFRWRDRWWALGGDERRLYAYYSSSLRASDWEPHAGNPVVTDRPRAARPAGRPIVRDGYVLVFVQDCADTYGKQVRAFRVTDLSPDAYDDVETSPSPVLGNARSAIGWNSGRMHHVDAWEVEGAWRCAVDGNIDLGASVFGTNWSIGMYESTGGTADRSHAADTPATHRRPQAR